MRTNRYSKHGRRLDQVAERRDQQRERQSRISDLPVDARISPMRERVSNDPRALDALDQLQQMGGANRSTLALMKEPGGVEALAALSYGPGREARRARRERGGEADARE